MAGNYLASEHLGSRKEDRAHAAEALSPKDADRDHARGDGVEYEDESMVSQSGCTELSQAWLSSVFHLRYEVLSVVGSGSASRVYQVSARVGSGTLRQAAKVVEARLSATERLQDEYLILKALSGKAHVVQVVEAYWEDPYCYIIMERCELHMVVSLANRRLVGELTMAFYFEQCFKALVEIHDAGVIHLDIRPDNFMVYGSEETVKLIDFGKAVEIAHAPPVSEVDGGNVSFMAPERLSGSKLGKEADVWSLGVSLFGLLYGHYPYEGSDCRDAIVTGSPEPSYTFHEEVTAQFPSNVVASHQVMYLLRSLMARDPAERCSAYDAMNFSWLCKARGLSRTEIDVLVALEKPVVNLVASLQCAAANRIFGKARVAPADERDKAMDRAMDALQSQSVQSFPHMTSTKGSLESL